MWVWGVCVDVAVAVLQGGMWVWGVCSLLLPPGVCA